MTQRSMPKPESVDRVVELAASALEVVGVVVIVIGATGALGLWVAAVVGGRRSPYDTTRLRARLGRSILLGIEFLVAADIVGTVAVDPSLRNVAILGFIVLIRTFLSFALEVEIEGRWPWQGDEGPEAELEG